MVVGKSLRGERRDRDARLSAGDKIRDDLRGSGRRRHADMTVTKRMNHMARKARAADHRQAIGNRRPMPHPSINNHVVAVSQPWKRIYRVLDKEFRATPIRRSLDTRDLHLPGYPDTCGCHVDCHFTVGGHYRLTRLDLRILDNSVVAALAL